MTLHTLIGDPWPDYALIDSGDGRKLERYGPYRFIRPEPQAMWAPATPDWNADGEFVPGADEDGGGGLAPFGQLFHAAGVVSFSPAVEEEFRQGKTDVRRGGGAEFFKG